MDEFSPWTPPESFGPTFMGSPNFSSDVYSFGVLLWELATCGIPFEGQEAADVLAKLSFQSREAGSLGNGGEHPLILDLKKKAHDMPSEYTSLISHCLSVSPGNRPYMSEVVRQLAVLCGAQQEHSNSTNPMAAAEMGCAEELFHRLEGRMME